MTASTKVSARLILSLACTKPATFVSDGASMQRLSWFKRICIQALPFKKQGYAGHVMQQGFMQQGFDASFVAQSFDILHRPCALTAASACHQQDSKSPSAISLLASSMLFCNSTFQ